MKFTKAEVGFEAPAKGPHHCSQCRHWRPPLHCEIVQGNDIDADDWCRRFLAKKSTVSRALGRKGY